MQKAAQSGFNINGRNNRVFLNRSDHIGGHPIYSRAVMEELGDISLSAYQLISISAYPSMIAKEWQRVSDTLQNAIQQGTFGPWE